MSDFATAAAEIIAVGQRLYGNGLAPATAGNYSSRLDNGTLAITVSGAHKGRLDAESVMRVTAQGDALDAKRPSAETLLHCLIYALDIDAGAVLHTHSVAGVALSRAGRGDSIPLAGYEMLKAFPGIVAHDTAVALPLVDNSQDMAALSAELRSRLVLQKLLLPAFYIRGHGLYAWGPTMAGAENIVEATEYLLACEWETLKLAGRRE